MKIYTKESFVVSSVVEFLAELSGFVNSFNDLLPTTPQSRPFRNRSPVSFPPVPTSINSGIELPRRWNQENRKTERRDEDRGHTEDKKKKFNARDLMRIFSRNYWPSPRRL